MRRVAGGIAIAMSLYHMWFAASAPPEAMIFRGTHLLFALVLVFLYVPALGREGPRRHAWLDLALVAAAAVAVGYIFVTSDSIVNRIIYIDELTAWDKAMAVRTVVLVLDASRRLIGRAHVRSGARRTAAGRRAVRDRRGGHGEERERAGRHEVCAVGNRTCVERAWRGDRGRYGTVGRSIG